MNALQKSWHLRIMGYKNGAMKVLVRDVKEIVDDWELLAGDT